MPSALLFFFFNRSLKDVFKNSHVGVDEASGLEAASGILKRKTNALQSIGSSSAFFNMAQQSGAALLWCLTMRKTIGFNFLQELCDGKLNRVQSALGAGDAARRAELLEVVVSASVPVLFTSQARCQLICFTRLLVRADRTHKQTGSRCHDKLHMC